MTDQKQHADGDGKQGLVAQYDNMLSCIRCGLCSSVCPTYQETFNEAESPRGRIAMARAFAEGHLELTPDFIAHSNSCLLCEACTAVCPAGVHMEPIGIAVRSIIQSDSAAANGDEAKLLRGLFSNMGRLRVAFGAAKLYQKSGLRSLARASGILKLLRLERKEQILPRLRSPFLVPRGQTWHPDGEPASRVGLFAGCAMSTIFADTDRATADVLATNGCEVVANKGQGCCGALHLHTGDIKGARNLAIANIEAFKSGGLDAVIVNAAGCGSALKGYGELLHDDPEHAEDAREFASKVKDVTEFLAGLPLTQPSGRTELTVTYQEPCHLAHAQRIRQQPRKILGAIPGVRVVELRESSLCCGSAGVYNLTQPDMADALLQRKVKNIMDTGADVVVTANPGCFMQIEAGLRAAGSDVRVMHIVDLLHDAYKGVNRQEQPQTRELPEAQVTSG